MVGPSANYNPIRHRQKSRFTQLSSSWGEDVQLIWFKMYASTTPVDTSEWIWLPERGGWEKWDPCQVFPKLLKRNPQSSLPMQNLMKSKHHRVASVLLWSVSFECVYLHCIRWKFYAVLLFLHVCRLCGTSFECNFSEEKCTTSRSAGFEYQKWCWTIEGMAGTFPGRVAVDKFNYLVLSGKGLEWHIVWIPQQGRINN